MTDFEILMQFKRDGITALLDYDRAQRLAAELKAEGLSVVIINQLDSENYFLSDSFF